MNPPGHGGPVGPVVSCHRVGPATPGYLPRRRVPSAVSRYRSLPWSHPLVVRAVVVGLIFVLTPAVLVWLFPAATDPATIRRTVRRFGPLAPVAFVAVQSLQVLLAPVPGQAIALVGGYLFGPVLGGVYSLLGTMAGSYVAFVLVRRYGRPYLLALAGPDRMAEFDEFVGRGGLWGVLLLYLVPGLPDDAVCFLSGMTDLRLRTLVAVSGLGRAPSLFVASFVGAGVAAGRYAPAVAVAALVVLLWALGYRYRERLVDRLHEWLAVEDELADAGAEPPTG